MVRPRDLAVRDVPPDYLNRLYRRGLVERVARGLYAWPDAGVGEHHTLAKAARQVPRGVVCLLSALRFHGLTTQSPHQVWLALPPRAWVPRVEHLNLRLVWFSGRSFTEMVGQHQIEHTAARVYGVAKTVAGSSRYPVG
jgi:predicted transcriptional regulator of viral defense system